MDILIQVTLIFTVKTLWNYISTENNAITALRRVFARDVGLYDIDSFTFMDAFYATVHEALMMDEHPGFAQYTDLCRRLGLVINLTPGKMDEYNVTWRNAYMPQRIPGVEETLRALKEQGYRLIAVGDGYYEQEMAVLQQLGLFQYFDNQVFANFPNLQYSPMENLFRDTIGFFNLNPASTFVVGSRAQEDIMGAINFGLSPVFFNQCGFANHVIDRLNIPTVTNLGQILNNWAMPWVVQPGPVNMVQAPPMQAPYPVQAPYLLGAPYLVAPYPVQAPYQIQAPAAHQPPPVVQPAPAGQPSVGSSDPTPSPPPKRGPGRPRITERKLDENGNIIRWKYKKRKPKNPENGQGSEPPAKKKK